MTTEPKERRITALYPGGHEPNGKMCLMEAVAWTAGEPWSAHPECTCPVLAAFGRAWNDGMRSNDERAQLLPYIPLLIGTRSSPEVEQRRAYMALDWLARTFVTEHAGDAVAAARAARATWDTDAARAACAAWAAWADGAAWADAGAAWEAAWAAGDARPPVASLRLSAHDLFRRMIAAEGA